MCSDSSAAIITSKSLSAVVPKYVFVILLMPMPCSTEAHNVR